MYNHFLVDKYPNKCLCVFLFIEVFFGPLLLSQTWNQSCENNIKQVFLWTHNLTNSDRTELRIVIKVKVKSVSAYRSCFSLMIIHIHAPCHVSARNIMTMEKILLMNFAWFSNFKVFCELNSHELYINSLNSPL